MRPRCALILLSVIAALPFGCATAELRIPITLRSLVITSASLDTVTGHKELDKHDLKDLEHRMLPKLLNELLEDGPFRSPYPSEAPYEVYVEFRNLSAQYKSEDMLLRTPMRQFFGLPIGYASMSGYGLFKILAPDQKTLVHETITRVERENPISLYRGRRYGLDDVSVRLADVLRQQADQRRRPILLKAKIDSAQAILKSPLHYTMTENGQITYYFNNNGQTQINNCATGSANITQNNSHKQDSASSSQDGAAPKSSPAGPKLSLARPHVVD